MQSLIVKLLIVAFDPYPICNPPPVLIVKTELVPLLPIAPCLDIFRLLFGCPPSIIPPDIFPPFIVHTLPSAHPCNPITLAIALDCIFVFFCNEILDPFVAKFPDISNLSPIVKYASPVYTPTPYIELSVFLIVVVFPLTVGVVNCITELLSALLFCIFPFSKFTSELLSAYIPTPKHCCLTSPDKLVYFEFVLTIELFDALLFIILPPFILSVLADSK